MGIVPEQGGYVFSLGGNRFLTLSAGYLGSLLWGVGIYTVACGTRLDRKAMACLGISIAIITVTFVRSLFALAFGVVTALAMLWVARFCAPIVNDFVLRLIGLTSMLYAPLDIYSDTIARSALRSDARMLAEEFGGTTVVWGGLWMLISLVAVFYCVRWSIRKEKGRWG